MMMLWLNSRNEPLGLYSIVFGKTEDFLMKRCVAPDTHQTLGIESRGAKLAMAQLRSLVWILSLSSDASCM